MKRPSKPWLLITSNKPCADTNALIPAVEHRTPASFIDAIAVEVKKKNEDAQDAQVAQGAEQYDECCDDNPLLDYYHEDLLALFYELRDALQLRGLMANSRPEGIVDAITRSVTFTHEEVESSESEEDEFDELEPNLLDVQTGI